MPLPDDVKYVCIPCLAGEAVGERLAVVHPVSETCCLFAKCDSCGVEKRCVSMAQGVVAHAGPVEVTEGGDEGVAGVPVITADRELEALEYGLRIWAQRHDPYGRLRLGRVHEALAVARAANADDMALYVAWLDGDGLAPPKAGQQDELRDFPPDSRHLRDHSVELFDGQLVATWGGRGYPRAIDWSGHRGDHPAPDRVVECRCESCVDACDGGRRPAGGEQLDGELGQVLGAQGADGDVTEDRLDVLGAGSVDAEGVGAGGGSGGLGVEPCVECCAEGFLCTMFLMGECPFSNPEIVANRDVRVPPRDLASDVVGAAAGLSFRSAMAAAFRDRGH